MKKPTGKIWGRYVLTIILEIICSILLAVVGVLYALSGRWLISVFSFIACVFAVVVVVLVNKSRIEHNAMMRELRESEIGLKMRSHYL